MEIALPWSSFWQIHFPRQWAVNRNTDIVALPVSPCGEASTSQQSSEKIQERDFKQSMYTIQTRSAIYWLSLPEHQEDACSKISFSISFCQWHFSCIFSGSLQFSWTGLTARLNLVINGMLTIAYDHWGMNHFCINIGKFNLLQSLWQFCIFASLHVLSQF